MVQLVIVMIAFFLFFVCHTGKLVFVCSLHIMQEKVEQDSKKLRQSAGFKAKQNEYSYRGAHLSNNHMKKVYVTSLVTIIVD